MITADLSNTPGQYYALAYWLSSMLYIHVAPRRIKGWKLWGISGIFLLILLGFMTLTHNIPVSFFVPTMMVTVFTMFLLIFLCCDLSVVNAGFYCVRAFILGELAASLEWQLFYYGLITLRLPLNMIVNLIFLVVTHTLVFGLMYLLERKYRADVQRMYINHRELISAVIIGISAYAISNLSYVYKNTPFSSQFPAEIFIIRTLVDLGGVGILFAYHVLLQEVGIKSEMESMQNILHMQYNNYKISEESIAMVNKKYHDLKHQIALLRAEVSSEEKLLYLDQMERDIKAYEAQNKTGNKVLDTILTGKSLQCQNQGISLTCVADGVLLDFMHPMDISTLFGNALDNAIESVKKIGNPDKRLIHLSVSKQKEFLRVRVENCYEGDIVFKDGIPATTKRDKQCHGYGIKSIQSTAVKYGGSVTINAEKGWFELRILIPLRESFRVHIL